MITREKFKELKRKDITAKLDGEHKLIDKQFEQLADNDSEGRLRTCPEN